MLNLVQRFAGLGEKFYARVLPAPSKNPLLIHFNQQLANEIDLNDPSIDWTKILGGQIGIEGYTPAASLYAGHQFGVWVSQLGDGRAMLIAEHKDSKNNIWELQTKGSGVTPFSRGADGRAVLRSSIREYLGSHAMNKLGVPTTQALAIIGASDQVYRERVETSAVVLRVAQSFIRFGSFEVFASRNQEDELRQLADFVIKNFFPKMLSESKPILAMYEEVIRLTAMMMAKWQALGFCHGVMNTDNMSILGLTLDYGPFGFLDRFDPNHICNHSDYNGRYSYSNQPNIAWWNLARLGESLLSLLPEDEIKAALDRFGEHFDYYYLYEFGNKLGIEDLGPGDFGLLNELLNILAKKRVDWTIFWRQFSYAQAGKIPQSLLLDDGFKIWLTKYTARRLNADKTKMQELMLKTNPSIVPRNYMLQQAIEKAESGDFSVVAELFRALNNPYDNIPEFAHYQEYPPESAATLVLSCSS